ncbi:hypothetical protein KDJ56_02120 [Brevibacillus composti]|uniref:Uncharacterized protein n=1 Tax=Brevibacillus composti TaxID=2796470 RepID=A0A7T5JNV2_9BACL|nr:hypothetical protein [Brevibacillus composti]QQE74803.1 hypothetical protein JD108_02120 [Brevibacillus composti]QUO41887.1 hypothetical protein KDJ56_02120 [Brevibacillus composti]
MIIARFLLELIRVVLVMFLGLMILGQIENVVYAWIGAVPNWWAAFVANFLLLLILYRNKLQFSGWFPSNTGRPLSKTATRIFLSTALALLIFPPMLATFSP